MNQRAHKCLNQAPEAEEYKIPVSTSAIMRPGDKSAKETVPPVRLTYRVPESPVAVAPPGRPRRFRTERWARRPYRLPTPLRRDRPRSRRGARRQLIPGRVKDDNRQPRQHAAMDARHHRWPPSSVGYSGAPPRLSSRRLLTLETGWRVHGGISMRLARCGSSHRRQIEPETTATALLLTLSGGGRAAP